MPFRSKPRQLSSTTAPSPASQSCAHAVLVPRWDCLAEMGQTAAICGFTCAGCRQALSLVEGAALQQAAAVRLAGLRLADRPRPAVLERDLLRGEPLNDQQLLHLRPPDPGEGRVVMAVVKFMLAVLAGDD